MIQQFYFWVYIQKNWEQGLKYLYTHNHSSIMHNSQKVEATQMSINGWMDKLNVVYTYNRIVFSLKKEENFDRCYNMDEPWGRYAKWNTLVTKNKYHMILLMWGI